MTSNEYLAIITGLGVLITALGAVVVNVILALKKKVDDVKDQTSVIEGHVNSAATRDAGIIDGQQQRIDLLRSQNEKLETTAQLLAAKTAPVKGRHT